MEHVILLSIVLDQMPSALQTPFCPLEPFVSLHQLSVCKMQHALDILLVVLQTSPRQMESLVTIAMNALKLILAKEETVLELELVNVEMVCFKQQLENNVMLVL
jgi:hypothetical protein